MREGRLNAGRAVRRAAAGPTPRPKDINVCTMGISPAVGMTNSVPVNASARVQDIPLTLGVTAGNNHALTAPSKQTSTTYSGITVFDRRHKDFNQTIQIDTRDSESSLSVSESTGDTAS